MTYRKLTYTEIAALGNQHCHCEDWPGVTVAEPFDADRIQGVRFSGTVRIGPQAGTAAFAGGAAWPCGLYDSAIHNCTIGANVCVRDVGNLSNYELADGVVVSNVAVLAVDGQTAFGNGTEIEVLNEGGGRPLRIYDRLSAQVAYLMVLYRHDAAMIQRLGGLIDAYVAAKRAATGHVEAGCRVENCGTLVNVHLGPYATVSGALELREGSIIGCQADPTVVGAGVIARNFIVLSGSRVEDSAMLAKCFVGQGVRIGKQFSAENSAFFANCEGFHGEACSIFAGPYTVTHHKSTLLIAGLLSFYNAGSASNQSNHMYKLGPLHQGILMRGAKTSSSSYLLWPSRVGPFNVVVGKHMANFDTSALPFSYVTTVDERTTITPAMNLFTVGTRRDSEKWPKRDRRMDADKLDLLNFDLFSPYLLKLTIDGSDAMAALAASTPREKDSIVYRGARIPRVLLRKAVKDYDVVIRIFLGECLVGLLESAADLAAVRSRLAALRPAQLDAWADLAGMLAPCPAVEALLKDIAAGAVADLAALAARLAALHAGYDEQKLRWCVALLEAREGIDVAAATAEQLAKIVTDWRDAALKLNKLILLDARKEFDAASKIGFGIDGDQAVVDADFQAVRGTFDDEKFVRGLRQEAEKIQARAETILTRLPQLAR